MNQDQIYNLVEAAKHGDDNAFAQLYEASYRMVYHVSLGYLKNNEDAEDITQEVFIKAYNSIHFLNDNLTFFLSLLIILTQKVNKSCIIYIFIESKTIIYGIITILQVIKYTNSFMRNRL